MNTSIAEEIQEQQNHGRAKYGTGPDDLAHDDKKTQDDWIELIEDMLERASWSQKPGERAALFIKIAGLAVSAVESYDRHNPR